MKLFNMIYWFCFTFGKANNYRDAIRQSFEKKGSQVTEDELDKMREAEGVLLCMNPYIRESLAGLALSVAGVVIVYLLATTS